MRRQKCEQTEPFSDRLVQFGTRSNGEKVQMASITSHDHYSVSSFVSIVAVVSSISAVDIVLARLNNEWLIQSEYIQWMTNRLFIYFLRILRKVTENNEKSSECEEKIPLARFISLFKKEHATTFNRDWERHLERWTLSSWPMGAAGQW